MRFIRIATAVVALCCFSMTHASQTIYYPSQKSAAFSVVAPDDWKLEPATEEGGFFNLNGPGGALISMRTITSGAEDIDAAVKDTDDYIKDNYKEVKLDKPKLVKGESYTAAGTGKDKEDGHAVQFIMVWARLGKDTVVEMWACVNVDDAAEADAAGKVLGSFKPH